MTCLINIGVVFVLLTNGAFGRFLPGEIFRNTSNSTGNEEQSETCNCEWRFHQHYEAKRCHVIQTDSCGCPTNYLCSSEKQAESQLTGCVYQGVEYAVGEKIKVADSCQVCRCKDGAPPGIFCIHRECNPNYPIHGENCHPVYEENRCCPLRYDCIGYAPENTSETSAVTCVYNNLTYPLGSKIYPPEDPCLVCQCKEDWNGIDNSNCYRRECGLEFEKKKHLLDSGCIPIYHEKRCCPIEYYCPEDLPQNNMELRELPTDNSTVEGGSCIFGENSYEIGEELALNNSCLRCTCKVPPDFTCVHQACPFPPSTEICQNFQTRRSTGQCCPTYDCLVRVSAVTETSETDAGVSETFITEVGVSETIISEAGVNETTSLTEADDSGISTTGAGDSETFTTEADGNESSKAETSKNETSETEAIEIETSETEAIDSETSETEAIVSETSETEEIDSVTSETEVSDSETSTTEAGDNESFTIEDGCPTPLCADDSCQILVPPGHECPTCICSDSREKNDFEPVESPMEQHYMQNTNETQSVEEGTQTFPTADDSENELLSKIFIEKLEQQNSNSENSDGIEPRMRSSESELQTEESTFPETEEYFIQFRSHDVEDVENHLSPNELRQKRSENMQTAQMQAQQSQQQWNVLQQDEDEMETGETIESEREFSDESNEGFDEIKAFGSKRNNIPSPVTVALEDHDFDNVIWTSIVPGCPTPLCANSSCRIGIPQGHKCPTCICKKARQP